MFDPPCPISPIEVPRIIGSLVFPFEIQFIEWSRTHTIPLTGQNGSEVDWIGIQKMGEEVSFFQARPGIWNKVLGA